MFKKSILIIVSTSGLVSVALGAFGSHALKELLTINERIETFDLASRYQFYHTLALLGIVSIFDKVDKRFARLSAILILFGMTLFSGSLYTLSITNITSWAIFAPFGGALLIAGWGCFLISVIKKETL